MNAPVRSDEEIWRAARVADDRTHHRVNGEPLYGPRFEEVLKFHAPGLAPVIDGDGAYHVDVEGSPVYSERYARTFGFYDHRAAVDAGNAWFHILPDGARLYERVYDWCGNYQNGFCTVRRDDGRYRHLGRDGEPAYETTWAYAGDFRSGIAAVQRDDGLHTHIDTDGELLHGRWFEDLDVFHKGFARAKDAVGWHHVDRRGRPLYDRRFADVEPFYNGQARVKRDDGGLEVIDETGHRIRELRPARESPLESLSGDMVGFWKTQAIASAVEVGVVEALPATAAGAARSSACDLDGARRLMRALWELELVEPRRKGADRPVWRLTDRGELLTPGSTFNMADAAGMWAGEHYRRWAELSGRLSAAEGIADSEATSYFRSMSGQKLANYQRAMSGYARHDYRAVPDVVDWSRHEHILDAGGGRGDLLVQLLSEHPDPTATLLELPQVTELVSVPEPLCDRFQVVDHDFFEPWPVSADAVVLARVLHDWNDEQAHRILGRARDALEGPDSRLYIVEMLLDQLGSDDASPNGGLLDLNMLAMTGGRERTLDDFESLLEPVGMQVREVHELPSVSAVIEVAPSDSSENR